MKFLSTKSSKFENFDYLNVMYVPQKGANNVYNTNSKRKSMIFCEKKFWGGIFDFSLKGGPFEAKIVKNNFFNFSKIFKTNPQPTLIGQLEHR